MHPRSLISPTVLLVLLAGCSRGPTLGEVEGVVRVNGQPLPGAEIEFQPDDGRSSFAVTDAEGRYRLQFSRDRHGALPGRHTVKIRPGDREDAQGNAIGPAVHLPEQYNDESILVRDVAAGNNAHDFELSLPANAIAGQGDARAVR